MSHSVCALEKQQTSGGGQTKNFSTVDKAKVRILIVEDNEFYLDLFVRLMHYEGYRDITQAADGLQAMNLIRVQDFDAVLLDIMMPKLDGYGVLEQLKGDLRLRHLPVIMISTVDEMGSVIKCIELGADDYLPKPVNPTLLRARLGACLEKKYLRDMEQVYLNRIQAEKRRVDELLHITLPPAAAEELKTNGDVRPRRFDNVAVLFCDVIRFTEYCNRLLPEDIIRHVTDLIECFEKITEAHGMEKIKTIGDEFMATAGLLEPNSEPLDSAIRCGLAMSAAAPRLEAGWQVRAGLEFGSVIAGIVGHQKYQFDLWGDTVNTAARMTRFGEPGYVTMTRETSEQVRDRFEISSHGTFDVKGKGIIDIIRCR